MPVTLRTNLRVVRTLASTSYIWPYRLVDSGLNPSAGQSSTSPSLYILEQNHRIWMLQLVPIVRRKRVTMRKKVYCLSSSPIWASTVTRISPSISSSCLQMSIFRRGGHPDLCYSLLLSNTDIKTQWKISMLLGCWLIVPVGAVSSWRMD